MEQCMMEMEIEIENYLTELREINGTQTVAILNDQSTLYVVTRKDPFGKEAEPNAKVPVDIIPKMPLILAFTFNNCYLLNIFQGIMPNSGAIGVLTTKNPQFLVLLLQGTVATGYIRRVEGDDGRKPSQCSLFSQEGCGQRGL